MSDLQGLRAAADKAEEAFDDECRKTFPDGRWGYYREVEGVNGGRNLTPAMHAAMNEYHRALHAFYGARDGDRGFLGKYGA